MKNDYELLDHLTKAAIKFVPNYIEFIEQS